MKAINEPIRYPISLPIVYELIEADNLFLSKRLYKIGSTVNNKIIVPNEFIN